MFRCLWVNELYFVFFVLLQFNFLNVFTDLFYSLVKLTSICILKNEANGNSGNDLQYRGFVVQQRTVKLIIIANNKWKLLNDPMRWTG